MPSVYIILINWNNAADTCQCLESLSHVTYSNFKILVVDNASTDSSLHEIRKWLSARSFQKNVEILPLAENRGFTGGNNAGIEHALKQGADYVLILNNDTFQPPDFLDKLVTTAGTQKNLGILGCTIFHHPETQKVWCSGGSVDFFLGYGRRWTQNTSGLVKTDFVCGCLMLIPAEVLRKVGVFNEIFFFISEDSELSWRIRQAGYDLFIDRGAHIFHKISSSAGGFDSPTIQYYFHRNRMLFMKMILNPVQRIFFYLLQFLLIIPGWIVCELIRGKPRNVGWACAGYRDFLSGVTGKAPNLNKNSHGKSS